MKIKSGLESGQVLQVSEHGAQALVEGTCDGPGRIELTLFEESGKPIARAEAGAQNEQWELRLSAIPAGGPYRAELHCGDEKQVVEPLFAGDLWVLAGQSNMEGVGELLNVEPPSPRVQLFGLDYHWKQAVEPLHWLLESVDSAHWGCNAEEREKWMQQHREQHREQRTRGAGLGLSFGVALSDAIDRPIGLLACARGGTSMQQWSPELATHGGASLYGSMIRRIQHVGGVKGILWYQGESDANPVDAPLFPERFRQLVDAVRRDTGSPDLPFLFVQLGRFVAEGTAADSIAWNSIQDAQRTAATRIPNTAVAAAIDLELDDAIHIGTQGLRRLGRRLAILARKGVYGDETCHNGPMLDRIRVDGSNRDLLRVSYREVNGALVSVGRLAGFSIHDESGRKVPLIYKMEVNRGNSSEVMLWLSGPVPDGAVLWYGRGRDPYCNLVDSHDMAAPVFGPAPLGAGSISS